MTREEAIKEIKKAMPYMWKETKEAIGVLVPEFTENEDDNMMKDIVAAVEMHGDFTQSRKEEIYAYLKKQKPSFSHDIVIWGKGLSTGIEIGKTQKELFESGKGLYYYDGEKTTYCGYPATEEKQKDYHDLYKGVSQSEWFKENYEGKSLGEEQKPVENSGKELLYVSNKSYNIGYRDGKREAEQKTTEWSEADEVYLQYALWCVKQAAKVAKGENDMGACWSAERWLKSLHPSWKPSEEQMDALKSKLPIIKGTGNNVDSILESLYEQLKQYQHG